MIKHFQAFQIKKLNRLVTLPFCLLFFEVLKKFTNIPSCNISWQSWDDIKDSASKPTY